MTISILVIPLYLPLIDRSSLKMFLTYHKPHVILLLFIGLLLAMMSFLSFTLVFFLLRTGTRGAPSCKVNAGMACTPFPPWNHHRPASYLSVPSNLLRSSGMLVWVTPHSRLSVMSLVPIICLLCPIRIVSHMFVSNWYEANRNFSRLLHWTTCNFFSMVFNQSSASISSME
jgi:hypothetical protein